jgi:hypothetical protein
MSADLSDRLIIFALVIGTLGPPNVLAAMLKADGVISHSNATTITVLTSATFMLAFAYVVAGIFETAVSSEVSMKLYAFTTVGYTALFSYSTVKHIGTPLLASIGFAGCLALLATLPLLEQTSAFRRTVESVEAKLAGLEGSL